MNTQSPTNTNVPPSSVPIVPAQQETETVEKVANVLVRAKSGTSKFLKTFAAPVTAAVLTGVIVSRSNRSENDDDNLVLEGTVE